MKGGCVVTGRGVVPTLTAVEEDLGTSVDVAVAGDKVEQRIIKFPSIFRRFGSRVSARNLSQVKVELN